MKWPQQSPAIARTHSHFLILTDICNYHRTALHCYCLFADWLYQPDPTDLMTYSAQTLNFYSNCHSQHTSHDIFRKVMIPVCFIIVYPQNKKTCVLSSCTSLYFIHFMLYCLKLPFITLLISVSYIYCQFYFTEYKFRSSFASDPV